MQALETRQAFNEGYGGIKEEYSKKNLSGVGVEA